MATPLRQAFGSRVRQLREQKGWSQEGFAAHCGVHRTYMGGIERGERNPTLEVLATIAAGLDVSLEELLRGV